MDLEFPGVATTVYQCIVLKHSTNFTDNRNVGTKFGFYVGVPNSATNHFFGFYGGRRDWFIPYVGLQVPGGGPDIQAHVGGRRFEAVPLGVWRKYEILIVGSWPGMPYGAVQAWVDGLQVINRRNAAIFVPGKPRGFLGVTWNPTYGGGLNPVVSDMFMYVDHWYVSMALRR